MDHDDHVALLRGGVELPGGVWADFGAGAGAFSLALADLIGPQGELYAVDKDGGALNRQRDRMAARFPEVTVHYHAADYTRPLDLPPLDGLVMANALHFQRAKEPVVRRLSGYLRPGGRFILVEYNVDRGNPWVPHPLSFPTWRDLAGRCGLEGTRLLAARPSRFLHEIYAALSFKPKE